MCVFSFLHPFVLACCIIFCFSFNTVSGYRFSRVASSKHLLALTLLLVLAGFYFLFSRIHTLFLTQRTLAQYYHSHTRFPIIFSTTTELLFTVC